MNKIETDIKEYGYVNKKYEGSNIVKDINKLKKEKNAIILAHFYQIPEIQDIADFIGDSLALSQKAGTTDAEMIVFCGVHFMAETAKLISPQKKVVLPDMNAGCSLADNCSDKDFKNFKNKYPNYTVITYINSSAEIKALSDIICTSSNAEKIVNALPKSQKIIFAPDKNLGSYVMKQTGRDMVLWDGTCEVHDVLQLETVINLKKQHTDAKLIAHPECKAPLLEIADFVGSTTALLSFIQKDVTKKFIVATETGIIHQMKKLAPEKEFIIVPNEENCSCNDCPYMKLNTLEKLYFCMKYEKPEIILDENFMDKAREPIIRMLELSK